AACNPYRSTDIEILERVQRKFSKLAPELKSKPNRTAGNWNALDVETRRINSLVLTEQSNVDKQTNNLTFRMENMDRKCWSHAVKAGLELQCSFNSSTIEINVSFESNIM
ncbi:hypothetical protein BpHYR1_002270, partial [Brachionus plicatilis]